MRGARAGAERVPFVDLGIGGAAGMERKQSAWIVTKRCDCVPWDSRVKHRKSRDQNGSHHPQSLLQHSLQLYTIHVPRVVTRTLSGET